MNVLRYEQPRLDHEMIVMGTGCEDNGTERCVIPTVLPVKDTLRWRLQLVCSSLCILTKLPPLFGRRTVMTYCSMRLLYFILPLIGSTVGMTYC